MNCDVAWLRALVREVADFPRPGVKFVDITPVLANPDSLRCAVELLADDFVGSDVELVAAVEARGFILGAAVACRLGAGFVPLRKPNKLPAQVTRVDYALEYGTDSLEMHADAIAAGQRVLLIDDVLATGGTAAAAVKLIGRCDANLVGAAVLATIDGLEGKQRLEGLNLVSVLGEI